MDRTVRIATRRSHRRHSTLADSLGHAIFAGSAAIIILSAALVYYFVGSQAFQTFTQSHVDAGNFFFSSNWDAQDNFGILYFILGSFSLVLLSLVLAVPLSLGIAIFLSEIAPPRIRSITRKAIELFLGIPSVIFGLVGLIVLVPLLRNAMNFIVGGIFFNGFGILPAMIVVSFMILPTIATISYDAMQAVPRDLREGSYAMGATRWQTIRNIIIPASLSGIMTGVILGVARALGETVAVAFVIGNSQRLPFGITHSYPYLYVGPTSVLTTQLLFNFKEATQGSALYNSLWTICFVLVLISGILVAVSRSFAAKSVYK
jgi:phosphate transport system permease protein